MELSECRVVRNGVKITGLRLEHSCRAPRGMCCSGFLLFLALVVPLKWQMTSWESPCATRSVCSGKTPCRINVLFAQEKTWRSWRGWSSVSFRGIHSQESPEWSSRNLGALGKACVFRVFRGVNVLFGPFLPSLLFHPQCWITCVGMESSSRGWFRARRLYQ